MPPVSTGYLKILVWSINPPTSRARWCCTPRKPMYIWLTNNGNDVSLKFDTTMMVWLAIFSWWPAVVLSDWSAISCTQASLLSLSATTTRPVDLTRGGGNNICYIISAFIHFHWLHRAVIPILNMAIPIGPECAHSPLRWRGCCFFLAPPRLLSLLKIPACRFRL